MTASNRLPPSFHDATVDRFVREGDDFILEIEDAFVAGPDVTEHGTLRLQGATLLLHNGIRVLLPIVAASATYARILDLSFDPPRVRMLLEWQLTNVARVEVVECVVECAGTSWTPRAEMKLARWLGQPVPEFLAAEPFKDWSAEREVDEEQRSTYEFAECSLQLRCDANERISTIFVPAAGSHGLCEQLVEVTFSFDRQQTRAHFGRPDRSGAASRSQILGESGPWDRFARQFHAIHVEYRLDTGTIKMITLMRDDVIP